MQHENTKLREYIFELSKRLENAKTEAERIEVNHSGIEALTRENEAIRKAIKEVQERNVFLAGKYKELEQYLAKYEEEQ